MYKEINYLLYHYNQNIIEEYYFHIKVMAQELLCPRSTVRNTYYVAIQYQCGCTHIYMYIKKNLQNI